MGRRDLHASRLRAANIPRLASVCQPEAERAVGISKDTAFRSQTLIQLENVCVSKRPRRIQFNILFLRRVLVCPAIAAALRHADANGMHGEAATLFLAHRNGGGDVFRGYQGADTHMHNDDIVIIQALSQCKDSVPEGFGARAPALCNPSKLIDPVVADNLNNTILMLRLADDLNRVYFR